MKKCFSLNWIFCLGRNSILKNAEVVNKKNPQIVIFVKKGLSQFCGTQSLKEKFMEEMKIQQLMLAGKKRRNAVAEAKRRRENMAESLKLHSVNILNSLFSNSADKKKVPESKRQQTPLT
jgi:hypothetical protein